MNRIFPKTIDNQYRGDAIAKWLFVIITIHAIVRSLTHMFLPDGGAQSIATIPLDTFSPNAASTIIGLFAYWGLSQLVFGLVFVLVLWRYQSLIPLMWVFMFIEYTGRLLIGGFYKPFVVVGTAPGAVLNHVFPVLALVMLVLSLKETKKELE
jgi:hypothetical protein